MRAVVAAVLIIGFAASPGAVYALDTEAKTELVGLYNLTVDLYSLVVGLFEDLGARKIEIELAQEKIGQWQDRYNRKTESVPPEGRVMCELMQDMLDLSDEIAEDYQPLNLRTREKLAELDEIKHKLKSAMTELRYVLK